MNRTFNYSLTNTKMPMSPNKSSSIHQSAQSSVHLFSRFDLEIVVFSVGKVSLKLRTSKSFK